MNNFELCRTVRTVSAKKNNKNKNNNAREVETLLAQGKKCQEEVIWENPSQSDQDISYVERVLLSKFGENRIKMETPKIFP